MARGLGLRLCGNCGHRPKRHKQNQIAAKGTDLGSHGNTPVNKDRNPALEGKFRRNLAHNTESLLKTRSCTLFHDREHRPLTLYRKESRRHF